MKIIKGLLIAFLCLNSAISSSSNDSQFKNCMHFVLMHEGGLTNNKNDPGGMTDFGVSLRFLRSVGLDMDGDGDIDADDIRLLNEPTAAKIYQKYWWDKYHYSFLVYPAVQCKVMDLSVNMGAIPAHKLLQQAINKLSKSQVRVDGYLGSKTFKAANAIDEQILRQALREVARDKYLRIIDVKPNMKWALRGWLARAAW